jgi:hypothetical protein
MIKICMQCRVGESGGKEMGSGPVVDRVVTFDILREKMSNTNGEPI